MHAGKRKSSKCQHTKPCEDCPWRKNSLPGWLGDYDADTWLQIAHGDGIIPCHVYTQQCAGAAIYRSNVCKSVRNPKALELPGNSEVFTFNEFKQHHEK